MPHRALQLAVSEQAALCTTGLPLHEGRRMSSNADCIFGHSLFILHALQIVQAASGPSLYCWAPVGTSGVPACRNSNWPVVLQHKEAVAMFFSGSIAEAIAASRQGVRPLIVLLSGESSKCVALC